MRVSFRGTGEFTEIVFVEMVLALRTSRTNHSFKTLSCSSAQKALSQETTQGNHTRILTNLRSSMYASYFLMASSFSFSSASFSFSSASFSFSSAFPMDDFGWNVKIVFRHPHAFR